MTNDAQARWAELVATLRTIMNAKGQDPGVLEVSQDVFRVALPLKGTMSFAEVFAAEDLVREDPRTLAARFYDEYQKAWGS